MAVFNFTVRATDSEGSYADRQFNITVRNSRVERFMIINTNDAWTSPDGTTWTQRVGQGGTTVAYGNGFWLIVKAPSSSMAGILKSTDGINFSYAAVSALTFIGENDIPVSPPTFNNASYPSRLKFWNGRFWMLSYVSGSGGSYDIWSSSDGLTWKRVRLYTGTTSPLSPSYFHSQLSMSEDNGTLIIPFPMSSSTSTANSAMGWTTTDGVTFTPVKNSAITATNYAAYLTRFNGLWIAQGTSGASGLISGSNYLYSTDGINWSTGTFTSSLTFSSDNRAGPVFYANGVIYSFMTKPSSTTVPGVILTSVDGLTWTDIIYKPFNASSISQVYCLFKNGLFLAQANSMANSFNDSTATTGVGAAGGGTRISLDGQTFTPIQLPGDPTAVTDIAAM